MGSGVRNRFQSVYCRQRTSDKDDEISVFVLQIFVYWCSLVSFGTVGGGPLLEEGVEERPNRRRFLVCFSEVHG